jgi:hypothetical protein
MRALDRVVLHLTFGEAAESQARIAFRSFEAPNSNRWPRPGFGIAALRHFARRNSAQLPVADALLAVAKCFGTGWAYDGRESILLHCRWSPCVR